jgi:hypothetical protein
LRLVAIHHSLKFFMGHTHNLAKHEAKRR